MKYRALVTVVVVVGASLLYSSLPWWLKYVALAAVAVGIYVILTCRTVPDDAPRAPRTV